MSEVTNTRLRFIKAASPDDLSLGVSSLPFKVEIKGNPVFDGKSWFVYFIIPDHITDAFKNIELT